MLCAPPQTLHPLLRPPLPPAPRCSADSAPSPSSSSPETAGSICRLVLAPEGREKLDPRPDRDFYAFPRLVTHVDDGFIAALTELYRERLRPGWDVLDLMSSWVSHLPPDVRLGRAVGHGLNAPELARNPRPDHFFVKDLNRDQRLELGSCSFDAVLCTVSVQYLESPEKEIFRVLKPGGVCIVSFSNRMFREKAIAAWREGTAYSRVQLVTQYFQCVAVHAARGGQEAAVRRRRVVGLAAGRRDAAVRDGQLRPVLRRHRVQELQANVEWEEQLASVSEIVMPN